MLAFTCPDQTKREQLIGCYIRPVAHELRSLELDILVQQMAAGRPGNLESVVDASSELYFRPGTLRCNHISEIDLCWGSLPKVSIGLTFASQHIVAAFVLQLDTFSAGVELLYASFPDGLSAKQETQLLERGLKASSRDWRSARGGARQLSRKAAQPGPKARPTQVFATKLV